MNPGDTVQVYRPGHPQGIHGRTGILDFISDAYTAYVVIDGRSYPVHPADIQPLEEPA